MSILARAAGELASLYDGDKCVLKAYSSPDGSTLRIVLPELTGPIAGSVTYHAENDKGVHYIQVKRPLYKGKQVS